MSSKPKAYSLRHDPTLSEQRLWSALKGSRLGVPFRRQVVRARLDAQRDKHLERAGYRVMRMSAALVMHDLAAAVALIRAEI